MINVAILFIFYDLCLKSYVSSFRFQVSSLTSQVYLLPLCDELEELLLDELDELM